MYIRIYYSIVHISEGMEAYVSVGKENVRRDL